MKDEKWPGDRYMIQTGKFGQYFFDKKSGCPVDLNEALEIMNEPARPNLKLIGCKVAVFNRYLFAVPVKGTIVGISSKDNSFQIVFDENNPGGTNVNKHDNGYFFQEECKIIVNTK